VLKIFNRKGFESTKVCILLNILHCRLNSIYYATIIENMLLIKRNGIMSI